MDAPMRPGRLTDVRYPLTSLLSVAEHHQPPRRLSGGTKPLSGDGVRQRRPTKPGPGRQEDQTRRPH